MMLNTTDDKKNLKNYIDQYKISIAHAWPRNASSIPSIHMCYRRMGFFIHLVKCNGMQKYKVDENKN